jgi:hypothetical protein
VDVLRVCAVKFDDIRDDAGRIRPANNQVAKENKRVGISVTRQGFENATQLRAASVNVSDHKGSHHLRNAK